MSNCFPARSPQELLTREVQFRFHKKQNHVSATFHGPAPDLPIPELWRPRGAWGFPGGSPASGAVAARSGAAAAQRPRARSCSGQPDVPGRRRSGWLPLAFLPPRPAARPSESERRVVPMGLEAAGGAAARAGRRKP